MKPIRLLAAVGIVVAILLTSGLADTGKPKAPPEELYKEAVERLDDLGRDGFWQAAHLLSYVEIEDAALLEKGLEEADEFMKVASARALLKLASAEKGEKAKEYAKKAEEALWKIISDEEADLYAREYAITTLGDSGCKENAGKLLEFADKAFEPELGIAAVYRAYKLTDELKKKELLEDALTSDRIDLRATAAVALADMGELSKAKDVLNELKNEPTMRGLLAAKLLENEELYRQLEKSVIGGPDVEKIRTLERRCDDYFKAAQEAVAKANALFEENKKLKEEIERRGGEVPGEGPGPGPGPGPGTD
ncbi:MAG: hypothetical protein ABIH04_03985 [Planctomycetota bacterium]